MKIGMIGLGRMGFNMARLLIGAQHDVFVYDINHEKVEQIAKFGGKPAENPKKLSTGVKISLLSLPMPADVESVVCGQDGILAGSKVGHIIVDLSTSDPFLTRKIAQVAQKQGVGYLDAPVLGLPQSYGKWTVPVGGQKKDFAKVSKVLAVIAEKVVYAGPSGNGNIIKLLNNLMFGAVNMISVEILALCAKLGMDPVQFYEIVATSNAASVSKLFVEIGPMILARDFKPFFSIELLHKDNELGIQMAKKAGAPLFMATAAHSLTEAAQAKGLGKEGVQAAIKTYESIFNIRVEAGR